MNRLPARRLHARRAFLCPETEKITGLVADSTGSVEYGDCGQECLRMACAAICCIFQYCHSRTLSIFENAFQESFIELHAHAFFVTRAFSRHEAQIKHFRYVITFQFRKEEEKHIHYPCKMNAKIIPRVHVNSTQYN